MSKKNILFVDDEPNILSGLKRMLRSMRKEMDFHFAESGQAALDLIDEKPIDVIVSDMRMPGMDGATLLTTIRKRNPEITRIMLTGQADEDSIMRTVEVVHQCLAKPLDPDALREILTRACALHERMSNDALRSLIGSLSGLPSIPAIYNELQDKLNDPECVIGDIAEIIEKDISMTAKILQLVNSAFFGLYKNIETPGRAVNLLGLDTIKALVLGIGVFSELKGPSSKVFSLSDLWDHSVTVAGFAKKIAQLENADKKIVDDAFIAGMIHDIGKLLLFSTMNEQTIEAAELARSEQTLFSMAEEKVFNADHTDVGGYLIGLWGLPGSVVEAIAFHHRLGEYPEPSFCPALAVHAADAIYYTLKSDTLIGAAPELNQEFIDRAGKGDRYEVWLKECGDMLE